MGLDIIPGKDDFNKSAAADIYVRLEGPEGTYKYHRLDLPKEDRVLLTQFATKGYETLGPTGARAYTFDSLKAQVDPALHAMLSPAFDREMTKATSAAEHFGVNKAFEVAETQAAVDVFMKLR